MTTSAHQNIAATQTEAEDRRIRNLAELRILRPEKKKLEKKLRDVEAEFYEVSARRERAQNAVQAAMTAIAEHEDIKPEFLAELGDSDVECVEWARKNSELVARLQKAIAARDSLQHPDVLRLRGVRLAAEIGRLRFAEANLARAIRGEGPGPRGGISAVR